MVGVRPAWRQGGPAGMLAALAPRALVAVSLALLPAAARASVPRAETSSESVARINLAAAPVLALPGTPGGVSGLELFSGDEIARALDSLHERAQVSRFALGLDIKNFSVGVDATSAALASRARELRVDLLRGLVLLATEPLRGPPEACGDLHQGVGPCLAGTRIGGLELQEPFRIGGERRLSLDLHWACEADSCRLTSGKPLDPWGLAVSVAKNGTIVISDERSPTGATYRVSRDDAEANRALLQKALVEMGGLSPEDSDKFVTEHDLGARTEAERAQAMGALTSGMTERWLKDAARVEAEAAVSAALGYGAGKAIGAGVRWGMGRIAGTRAGEFLSKELWASAPESLSIVPEGGWKFERPVVAKPRGGENRFTRAGRLAHDEEPLPPGFKRKVRLPSGKEMDAYNEAERKVIEIKPNNPRAIRKGEKQVGGYCAECDQVYGPGNTGVVQTYDPTPYLGRVDGNGP